MGIIGLRPWSFDGAPFVLGAPPITEFLVDQRTAGTSFLSWSITGLNFGSVHASSRVLVAVYSWCLPTDAGAHSVTSMTIGGVAATRAVRGGNSNTRQLNSEIWYVAENTLTSGDIVMTESGNNANYRALDLYRMGGVTTTPHATAGNESLSDLSLAVDAGGFAVALSTNQQSTAIPTLTGITNDVAVSVGARHGAQFGAQIIGASGTLTIGSDMGSTNGACKCAASWSP